MDIQVLREEKDYLALMKPAGVLVHKTWAKTASPQKNGETLVDWVLARYPEVRDVGDAGAERDALERYGIVHRLDRDTSGVIVVARTQEFFEHLKQQFGRHEVRKEYTALVYGALRGRGAINKPIGLRSGSTRHSVNARNMKMVKEAVTEYEAVEEFNGMTLLRVMPKTGRTHQIRVHLASVGCPVVGDALYGRKRDEFGIGRQFLHASAIEFLELDGKRVRIESELPQELEELVDRLRKSR